MQLLKERIIRDGKIGEGNILKVDSFLNHQMDIALFNEIGREFKRRFANCDVNKILTIESSGIGIACITAQFFDCPVVFAKKHRTLNIFGDVYTAKVESYTHKEVYDVTVSKAFLGPQDRILIIDDFLAKGNALNGLLQIIEQAGAKVEGIGIVVEKAFQEGGDLIRSQGIRVESLARVKALSVENGVSFVENDC